MHEQLLHEFYNTGDGSALDRLSRRLDPYLARIAHLILLARGIPAGALGEWDIDDRLANVWAYIYNTRQAGFGRWPHQRMSALHWLIYLLGQEMDRRMDFLPPF
jgi:hypothetical protein